MEKYSCRDRPLTVCLAWQEHRRVPLVDLTAAEEALGLYGEIIYLSPEGDPVAPDFDRNELAQPVEDPAVRTASLTSLRNYMTEHTHARLLLGGGAAAIKAATRASSRRRCCRSGRVGRCSSPVGSAG